MNNINDKHVADEFLKRNLSQITRVVEVPRNKQSLILM